MYKHLKNSCNLWNSTLVVVEDFNYNQCTVPEITTILQVLTNSMRNLHNVQTFVSCCSLLFYPVQKHQDIILDTSYVLTHPDTCFSHIIPLYPSPPFPVSFCLNTYRHHLRHEAISKSCPDTCPIPYYPFASLPISCCPSYLNISRHHMRSQMIPDTFHHLP